MKIEIVINELAHRNVTIDEGKIKDIDAQIQAKKVERQEYMDGIREQPKWKHLEKLKLFDDDLDVLVTQRNAITNQYASDIAAYKDSDNAKWDALAIVADDALKNSEWMMISDSTLTTDQKTIANGYRKSIMDLKENYETADEAIAAFELIKSNKPKLDLW